MLFKLESNNIIFIFYKIFRRYQDIVIIPNAITIFGWGELIKEENAVYLLILSPTRQGILVNAIHLLHEKYLAHLTFGRLKRLYWPQLPHFSANNNT